MIASFFLESKQIIDIPYIYQQDSDLAILSPRLSEFFSTKLLTKNCCV